MTIKMPLPDNPDIARLGKALQGFFESRGWLVKSSHAATGTAYYVVEHPLGDSYKFRISDHRNTSRDPEVTSTRRDADFNIVVDESGNVRGWEVFDSPEEWDVATEQQWRDAFKGSNPTAEDYPRHVRDLYPHLTVTP